MAAANLSSPNMADQDDRHTRVLFLIPTLHGGGAERVMTTLLRNLDRTSFKLALAVVDTQEAVFLNDVPKDVEFIDLGCRRVRYALPKIVALIWKRRPDVVFSMLRHLNLALAMLWPLLPRYPRYIVRETTVVSQALAAYRRPWFWRWMYRRFCGNHEVVVCQSQDVVDDLVANYAVPKERTVLIHNPVDVERIRLLAAEIPSDSVPSFKRRSAIVQFVAAGRLVEQKGFDLLIEALARLHDAHIRLTILGEGPLRKSLERLVHTKGLADRVKFAGFQANPYAWFVRADAFVLSSRYEGFPNVVLEALACRTPVIATPAPGGTREILDVIPECLVAKEISSRALADAIDEWMEGGRDRVSEEAAKPYSLSVIMARYEQLFHLP